MGPGARSDPRSGRPRGSLMRWHGLSPELRATDPSLSPDSQDAARQQGRGVLKLYGGGDLCWPVAEGEEGRLPGGGEHLGWR